MYVYMYINCIYICNVYCPSLSSECWGWVRTSNQDIRRRSVIMNVCDTKIWWNIYVNYIYICQYFRWSCSMSDELGRCVSTKAETKFKYFPSHLSCWPRFQNMPKQSHHILLERRLPYYIVVSSRFCLELSKDQIVGGFIPNIFLFCFGW